MSSLDYLDYWKNNDIVCPHCDHVFQDSWEYAGEEDEMNIEVDCENCGEPFYLSVEYEIKYTTSKEEQL